jgi:hypothetical protein
MRMESKPRPGLHWPRALPPILWGPIAWVGGGVFCSHCTFIATVLSV